MVDKPAGLVVHPAPGHQRADAGRGAGRPRRGGPGPRSGAGIVHRLDRDTSGLLVVAKSEASYAALQRR